MSIRLGLVVTIDRIQKTSVRANMLENVRVNIRCMLINSVVVDDRLISEFGPEMVLFRVDTIAKNHEEQPTIERIRINKK